MFMSTRHFGNFQVHFGMQSNQLVVKAQEDDRIFRLVAHEILYRDFPDSLASNYMHWLDLKSGIMEFRPLQRMWQPCARNWRLSLNNPGASTATMTQQGHGRMVDIHSQLFRQVATILNTLDASQHIIVIKNVSGIIEVEMVRMRLKFFLNRNGALESRELNGTVDYDQDIGCFYGLGNKLVLCHPEQQDSRSVLIPYGRVGIRKGKHHPLISIHPPEDARVRYFQYSLDPILRILRGPLDMMGTLYQAYMHAVTGFVLPDPATERSGTEEALRILRQAWLETPFPLNQECAWLLEHIAALTPRRQYYPSHLRTMQTVTWNSELGQLAQHDEFRVLVQRIVDHVNRFSCFHRVQVEQQEAAMDIYRKRGEQHLLERARHRHSHFHRSVFGGSEDCPSPRASWYHARDREIQSDRSRRVFEIAALVNSWPSSVPYCEDLLGTIKEWEYVRTAGPSIQDYTCTDLLQLSFRDAWGALYELCRSSDRSQDSYSLMSLFSMIAFGSENQLHHIRPLLALAFTGNFKDLPVPENQNTDCVLHLGRGQDIIRSDIRGAIEPYYISFRSFIIGQGGDPSDSDLQQERDEYYLDKENDIYHCVKTIENQWPNDGPHLPHKVRIKNHSDASRRCAQLWTCWYQNREFYKFLHQVQDRLNCMGTMDPVSWSVPAPPTQEPDLPLADDTPFQHPDLFHMLRGCKPVSAPKAVRSLRFCRQYASQYCSTGENSELGAVILDLCNEPNRHRRELGLGLQESLDALKKTELPLRSTPLPEVRDAIAQCSERLTEQQDHLWSKIHTALTTASKLWQQISGPIVWSPVTLFSILSLLSINHWQRVPDGWKSTILALAKIINSLRRCKRLLALYDRGDVDAFYKESESISSDGWDPKDSPEWLLFEIESNLTIRERQAEVAKKIIGSESSDNAVLQLNMGEGKTAVITPIAALTIADSAQLLRVMVLKPLLKQSVNVLSQLGGMLNRPIYYVPFSRDTPLDDATVEKLGQIYQDCRARRGILIALPEHLLSFRLVGLDLTGRGSDLAPKVIGLETWLQDNCRNVIDESDEILDPKFQLVYTVGHQQTMDGHSDRWEVTQSLLTLVEKKAIELQGQDPDSLDIEHNGARYPIFHFLKAEAADRLVEKVLKAIDDEGLSGIPFHQWTPQVRRRAMHFIRFIDTTDTDERLLRNTLEDGIALRKLLVLRGLLIHHILKFTLANKRWLVDYGLHPSRCMMAVPFRAKGIPSENAEFGHPDVAIMLTCLSYYYHGLTQEQVRHCFDLLLKENDPSVEYHAWIARGPSTLPIGLREITGVNLEDMRTFEELLYPHIRYQKGILDFYLSRVVFPREAKEFPHKLCTSAWDLPSRENQPLTTGFSGTNDNRFLLPKTAPQRDLPHLLHTNAMVLTYLLREENRQCVLVNDEQGRPLRARELVRLINQQDPPIRVIIDVGSQILEYSNQSVAEEWLSMSSTAEGAIFYDENDEAIVVNRKGDHERLFGSPFRHRMDSCLVYLDQQHARGVDLKLPQTYRAAVTLGPRVTKDRLVQACCRMRGLGNGQSVVFFVPPEVRNNMECQTSEVNSLDVVRWALWQTSDALTSLSPLWASHGLQYYKRVQLWDTLAGGSEQLETVSRMQEPEARTLSQLYAPWDPMPCLATDGHHDQRDPVIRELMRVSGGGKWISHLHEEQERQISHEVQREQQVHRPPGVSPRRHILHKDIRYFVKHGKFPTGRPSSAVQRAFECLHQTSAGKFDHTLTLAPGLYATGDFALTAKQQKGTQGDDFLKPVHWVLSSIHNSNLLLLSQYEANELIPEVNASKTTRLHVYTPRTTKSMRPFEDLRFFHTGATFDDQRSRHENTRDLELFAGSLYFESFQKYENFRKFLGLVTDDYHQIPDDRLSNEGFVDEQTRQEIGWPVQSPFRSNPLPFLDAIFNLRSRGHGYLQTHVGMILGARPLTADQF
ncbi:hypothetical protein BJX99DRAFT_107001 [Aspergillus californicus]